MTQKRNSVGGKHFYKPAIGDINVSLEEAEGPFQGNVSEGAFGPFASHRQPVCRNVYHQQSFVFASYAINDQ